MSPEPSQTKLSVGKYRLAISRSSLLSITSRTRDFGNEFRLPAISARQSQNEVQISIAGRPHILARMSFDSQEEAQQVHGFIGSAQQRLYP